MRFLGKAVEWLKMGLGSSLQPTFEYYLKHSISCLIYSKITKRNVVYHKLPLTTHGLIHLRKGFNLAGLLNGRAYIR